MSVGSIATVTISSSDNEDVQEVRAGDNKINTNHGDDPTNIRRVPLQRIATGKEVFAEFLEKCNSVERSGEMDKIVKKLWKRFNEADESYTKSRVFKELVLAAQGKVDKQRLYSTMKTVADELSNKKKSQLQAQAAQQSSAPSTSAVSSSTSANNGGQDVDPKTLAHINKLEKILESLHRRIQKLESIEVDLNSSDEENSAYIQLDRYKARFCKVHQKLCEMYKKDPHAERAFKKHIRFSGVTQIPEVDRAIEKFYNNHKEFPDYRDILTTVRKANEIKNLHLSAVKIDHLALKAFQELGKLLKKYRQLDDVEIFRSYISNDEDPATKDEDLEKTLEENKKKYGNRIDEVIDKYAVLQDEEPPETGEMNSEEEDSECEEDAESDDETRSSILESKSDLESADEAGEVGEKRYLECKVVLSDVRFTPAWDQYVVQREKQSSSDDSNYSGPRAVIKKNKRRSVSSSSEESDDSDDSVDSAEFYRAPIPSTSKQCIPPIKLDSYRNCKRAKLSERDGSTQIKSNRTRTRANIEKLSTENDSDVVEIINDSCESSVIDKKYQNDTTLQIREIENIPNEASPANHPGNVSNDDEISFSNNNFASSTQISDEKVETSSNVENVEPMIIDDAAPDSSISSSKSISKASNENKSHKKPADSKSMDNPSNVDVGDQPSNFQNRKLENSRASNHFMCNGSLPLEVVLDEDTSNTSKSVVEQNQSKTTRNIDNDIVVIDKVVKPKTPTKVSSDVIDVEEIDSPEQPKKPASKGLGQPVNLTQMIRGMNFKPETLARNKMPAVAGPSRQVTMMPRSNVNQSRPVGRHAFPNIRQMTPTTGTSFQRTINRFSNAVRPPNQFMNSRQPLNGRQFASMQTRNVQNMQNVQYFANNSNVAMKSGQTAMQRRQCTTHTVQTFDAKTNRVITRKETTVVHMQVVSQNRVVRQVPQINRQQISSNRSNCSDDIITLD